MFILRQKMFEFPELFSLETKRKLLSIVSRIEAPIQLSISRPTIENLRDHWLSLMTKLQFLISLVFDRLEVEVLFNIHRPPIIFIRLIKQIKLNEK